ncbi:flavodoxin family protein [Actinoplanes sp. NPDC049668]|uniref:flavodoxin family protein n=1 Tax=unclassified Actinoplanes TaxID=2626549 RepID=UPI0033A6BB03
MKALIVYESMFGNTEKIARAVAEGLGDAFDVVVADVSGRPAPVDVDLLVAGAPTHAFGMSRPGTRADAARQDGVRPGADAVGLREYLDQAPMLPGIAAAAFDTKIDKPFLPGSAAHRAHRRMRRLGCRMMLAPESFRVSGTAGPLAAGELERARRWAGALASTVLSERHAV